jgi:hypothetical protein
LIVQVAAMAHSIVLVLALALQAAAPALSAELQPLAFLVGSCWRAPSPGTTGTDTHCYTAMLGGRYIRDVHVAEGPGAPYSGETIYRWDPRARRIRFDYYASDGGYSWGFVNPTPGGLDFPGDRYVGGDGRTMQMRTVQTHQSDGYTNTSFARRPGRGWRELWTTRFTRVGPTPAR